MGSNQNLPVRQYAPQYKQMLSTVFNVKKAFSGVLAPIQIVDGVQHNAKAFSVKTNNTPVVIRTYNTGENVQFGTGTGSGSRFGNMTEVKYVDEQVDYSYSLAIHEGLDRYTVNNDLDAAVADRLRLQSEAQTREMNKKVGKFLSDNAGKEEALADLTEANVKALFNKINVHVIDSEINVPMKAYIRPEIYNAIVDMATVNTSKGANVSIDTNGLAKYKDIELIKTPKAYFDSNVIGIFAPDSIVIPFVGIETARTIEATEFDGVKLQAAAKGGNYILDDNKKAVVKVTGTIA